MATLFRTDRSIPLLLALLLFLLNSYGCGSDAQPDVPPRQVDVSGLKKTVDSSRIRQLQQEGLLTEHAQDVLDDGVITFPEYESSVLQAVQCIKDSGGSIDPGDPHLNKKGLYTFVPGWPLDHPEVEQMIRSCNHEYLDPLELFWKELVLPSEAEVLVAMDAMADCLVASGLGDIVPQSHAFEDFAKMPRQLATSRPDAFDGYVACARRIQDDFGLTGFAPYGPPP